MKITLDKEVIKLSELKEARDLRKEYSEYIADSNLFETLILNAITANKERIKAQFPSVDILRVDNIKVCKNHSELTVWIECLVKVDYKTIVEIHFDAPQAVQYSEGQRIDAYIQVYRREE